MNYQMQRNFDAANKTVDRALQINPQGIGLWEIKVKLAIAEKGDFSVYEQAVEKGKSFPISDEERLKMVGDEANLLLLQRKYQQILQLGQRFPGRFIRGCSGFAGHEVFRHRYCSKRLGR